MIAGFYSVLGIALTANEYLRFVQCFLLNGLNNCACDDDPAANMVGVELVESFVYFLCEWNVLHLNACALQLPQCL